MDNPGSDRTWPDDYLNKKRFQADPFADELISKVVDKYGLESSRLVFDKLIRNVELPFNELPATLHEYFREPVGIPGWFDQRALKKSWELFVDHGPKMLLLLFFKSLPLLYTDQKGARVLVKTGRLAHDGTSREVFARRIAETGQFLVYVMSFKAFQPENQGLLYIRKVRLIHAAIRHFIRQKNWDTEKLGEPVNQEDMALTLMTFSVSLLDGLEQLGLEADDDSAIAFFERWKLIGLLMGIDEDLIPGDPSQGRHLLNRILERQSAPSEEGKTLTRALIDFSKESIPGRIFDVAPESLIRYFIGKERSGYLGVPGPKGCLGLTIPAIFNTLFNLVENLEEKSPRIQLIADTISQRLVKGMVGYFDHYKQTWFTIPEEFNKHWEIR